MILILFIEEQRTGRQSKSNLLGDSHIVKCYCYATVVLPLCYSTTQA